MYSGDDITVLIATKDRVDQIERAIRSVFDQSLKVRVVVLDDASNVNIQELLGEKFSGFSVKWIRSEHPSGVTGARNKLVDQSNGNIMVFLDDDAYFSDHYSLEKIRERLNRSDNVAALAFKIILKQEKDSLQIPFKKVTRIFHRSIQDFETEVSYYIGAGHVIMRDAFEKAGGYQNDLFYGLEELDLSSEIIKEGKEIVYFPDVEIIHQPEKSVINKKNKLKDESYYSIRNRVWISYKHLPSTYLFAHLFIWCLFYFLKSLFKLQLIKFMVALFDGFSELRRLKRDPFNQHSLSYLKKSYGRLWY